MPDPDEVNSKKIFYRLAAICILKTDVRSFKAEGFFVIGEHPYNQPAVLSERFFVIR